MNQFQRFTESGAGCWIWDGPTDKDGYGRAKISGKTRRAHRAFYEKFVGPIPFGFEIDHLCNVRRCVNPKHLEAISREMHIRRSSFGVYQTLKTHCPRGHEYTPDNTIRKPHAPSRRYCRECNRNSCRAYYQKTQHAKNCAVTV